MLIEFSEMRGSKVCPVFRGIKSENYAITIEKKCMVFMLILVAFTIYNFLQQTTFVLDNDITFLKSIVFPNIFKGFPNPILLVHCMSSLAFLTTATSCTNVHVPSVSVCV